MGLYNCEEGAIAEVGRKSGACQADLSACVCDRLAVGTQEGHWIVSRRNKLLSTLNNQDAHQVGRTFHSKEFALANAPARYLILLSRQGKVVSAAACELDRGRS
jgi:hypothetical protein